MATILIVEDDLNHRLWLQEELELDGHTVIAVASGREALEAAERTLPDLVILDIAMPGMDGLDLLGRLLDIDNALPVVIHTAYGSYRDNFMSWAADAYVIKQSDAAPLKRTIRRVLASRRGPLPQHAPPSAQPDSPARL